MVLREGTNLPPRRLQIRKARRQLKSSFWLFHDYADRVDVRARREGCEYRPFDLVTQRTEFGRRGGRNA